MANRVRRISFQLLASATEGEQAPYMRSVPPILINGELVQAENGAATDVINPATGAPFAKVPEASVNDLMKAVAAAKKAFETWKKSPFAERSRCMKAFADALEKRGDEFARAIVLEQGKPLGMAKGEVLGLVFAARAMADKAEEALKPEVRHETPKASHQLHYFPRGVVGAICPWNFPLSTVGQKIVPAVMSGNTMVIKPSPYTPLSCVLLGSICKDVFPAGVVNILSGSNDLGQKIVEHPDIAHISFTGSAATGKKIMATGASNLKHLTLELGGNDPAIMLPDADPKVVAPKVMTAAMFNTGQICIAAKRLFVHESQYDEMVDLLKKEAEKVKMGDGLVKGNTHGPINNKMQLERVSMLVEEAKKDGARIVTGGKKFAPTGNADAYFYEPTVVADAKEGMRLVDEEQFGPVLPVIKYTDVNDAIRSANSTEYGLGGSVWTSDPAGKGAEVAAQIDSGMVWINSHITGMHESLPFGGVKGSGKGREGGGEIGIKEFVEMKSVLVPKK